MLSSGKAGQNPENPDNIYKRPGYYPLGNILPLPSLSRASHQRAIAIWRLFHS